MKARRRRRIGDSLREKLRKFKRNHLLENVETGSYAERVRDALEMELTSNPTIWPVALLGREAIIEFFMSGVWRDDTTPQDGDDEEQLAFYFSFEGKRLPSDITYRDHSAGRYKMRTVAIEAAQIWQWQRAGDLKQDKAAEAQLAALHHRNIGNDMLRAAGGDANKKISDVWDDRFEDAAC